MSAAVTLPAGVRGYVEARSAEAILGWAWDSANPSARVAVELLEGETVVAHAVADQPRDDLARNEVGDGNHAFRFDLTPELAERAAFLTVVARGADGRAQTLAAAPPPPALPPVDSLALARLQRGLEQVAAGQRAVLRLVKSAPEATPATPDLLERVAAAQAVTEAQLATLEVFVTRLDERLAAMATPAPAAGLAARTALLAGLVGAAAVGALLLALGQVV